jgi:hypothetical protein
MKCLHRSFVKNGEGEVKLVPEEGEQKWVLRVKQRQAPAATVMRHHRRHSRHPPGFSPC